MIGTPPPNGELQPTEALRRGLPCPQSVTILRIREPERVPVTDLDIPVVPALSHLTHDTPPLKPVQVPQGKLVLSLSCFFPILFLVKTECLWLFEHTSFVLNFLCRFLSHLKQWLTTVDNFRQFFFPLSLRVAPAEVMNKIF